MFLPSQMQRFSEFITLTEKVLRQVHHSFLPVWERSVAMCSHKRKSSRDSNASQESNSERDSF